MEAVRRRFLRWRRRWCVWRGHPQAVRSPVVMNWVYPNILNGDGTITVGEEHTIKAYRCALHDKKEM